MTYRLPQAFYDDHVGRDLPGGTEVKRTKKHVYVWIRVGVPGAGVVGTCDSGCTQ